MNPREHNDYWRLDHMDPNLPLTWNSSNDAVITTIESNDDEVILSSPRSFADAKLNSKRRRREIVVPVVDVDSGNTEEHIPILAFDCTRRRSALTGETVNNCDQYTNLESSWNSVNGNATKPLEQSTVLPSPTPHPEQSTVLPSPTPLETIFNCQICMNPLVKSMSTKCGHVYCESCIEIMDSSEPVISCDQSILESSWISIWNSVNGYSENFPEQSTVLQSPTPPPEPIFSCPICMNPFVESMTTKCGHVFCNSCIRKAIKVQKKCPTCRQKLTTKGIFRVYLPITS